jgi:hypothetical protein
MPPEENKATIVTFTVKELLTEIRQDVKDMRLELGKKADASELLALKLQFDLFDKSMMQVREQAAMVPSLQQKVDALTGKITTEDAVSSYRRWLQRGAWGVVLTLFVTTVNLVSRLLHFPS